MIDREKTALGIREMLMRDTWRDIDANRSRYQHILNDALDLLKSQPDVVRCKDCKFRNSGCLQLEKDHYPDDDWFCADGKRKKCIEDMNTERVIVPLQTKLDEARAAGLDVMLCSTEIIENVIALLKEQEPRILKPEEFAGTCDYCWLETKASDGRTACGISDICVCDDGINYEARFLGTSDRGKLPHDLLGSRWRCWSTEPTEEHRKAAVWE